MARIFLFPSESAPCNNKLAESLVNDLETSSAIGDVQVEDYIYGNDFSPILVPKSAFQGNNFMILCSKTVYLSQPDHSRGSLPFWLQKDVGQTDTENYRWFLLYFENSLQVEQKIRSFQAAYVLETGICTQRQTVLVYAKFFDLKFIL